MVSLFEAILLLIAAWQWIANKWSQEAKHAELRQAEQKLLDALKQQRRLQQRLDEDATATPKHNAFLSDDEAPSSVGGDDADAGVPGSPALETARSKLAAADKAKTQAQQDAKRALLRARAAEGTSKALAVKLAPLTVDLQEAQAKDRQQAALIQSLSSEVAAVRSEGTATSSALQAQLTAALAAAHLNLQERDAARSTLAESTAKLQRSQAEAARLAAQSSEASTRVDELRTALATAKGIGSSLAAELEDSKAGRAAAEAAAAAADTAHRESSQQTDIAVRAAAAAESNLVQARNQAELASAAASAAAATELAEALEGTQRLTAELEDAQGSAQEASERLAQAEAARAELAASAAQLSAQVESLQAELAASSSELSSLRVEYTESKQRAEAAEQSAAEAAQKLNEVTEKLRANDTALNAVGQNNEGEQGRGGKGGRGSEGEKAPGWAEDAGSQSDDDGIQVTEVERLTGELARVAADRDQLRAAMEELPSNASATRARLDAALFQNEQLQEQCEVLHDERDDLMSRLHKHKSSSSSQGTKDADTPGSGPAVELADRDADDGSQSDASEAPEPTMRSLQGSPLRVSQGIQGAGDKLLPSRLFHGNESNRGGASDDIIAS